MPASRMLQFTFARTGNRAATWILWAIVLPVSLSAGCLPTRPVVGVTGEEALHDFGSVAPRSVHHVVFAVENPTDRPVNIEQIRPDCECISVVDPPADLAAGGVTNITARYVAPKLALPYQSELIVVTDDPERRFIRLRVKSQP